jgi:hypothetical protein
MIGCGERLDIRLIPADDEPFRRRVVPHPLERPSVDIGALHTFLSTK